MPEKITPQLKRRVANRAKNCCEYCQSQARFAMQAFSVEHIIPKSREGKSILENLAFACQGCNNHKYNKIEASDPVNKIIVPLYHPRKHAWNDHFAWSDDFTQIIGLTSIGRATVEALQLNRKNLVNLRRILYKAGEHPPY